MKHPHADLLDAYTKNSTLQVERLMSDGWGLSQWGRVANDSVGFYSFRIHVVLSKDEINWDHVSDMYRYMARSGNGTVYLFENKPLPYSPSWSYSGACLVIDDAFSSYKRGECDWKDSLVERP